MRDTQPRIDSEHVVILAGSGRSGTTWIGDVLASSARCCPVFEPLHPSRVERLPRFGSASDFPGRYLRTDDWAEDWQGFFSSLLRGEISSAWTRQDWTRAEAFPLAQLARSTLGSRVAFRLAAMSYRARERRADRYVIKLIRGNLLLGWLARQFPVHICYLTRHPCAVVGSRLRLDWSSSLDDALAQLELVEDYLRPHRSIIESAETALQKMAVLWCIENLVPLSQLPEQNWTTCSYEACVTDPQGEFGRLSDELGLKSTRKTQTAIGRLVSTPSTDAGKQRAWHHPLSEEEGNEVLRICESLGIGLYGRQFLPTCDVRKALSGRNARQFTSEAAPS